MESCIFCKIIKKDIPHFGVYEDEHCLAFLDIYPRAKGHTVVIPKIHVETIESADAQTIATLFSGVQSAVQKVTEVLQPDAYSIGWNNGEVAGQAVPHIHVHILPRWKGDGGGNMHTIIDRPRTVSAKELVPLFL